MKKISISIFLILLNIASLNAADLNIIQPNSYYIKANINEVYDKLLALEETNKLIEVIDTFLSNETFKEYLYFEEIGKVKINTAVLLKQLKFYLAGWPKYSNTYFENHTNSAGIKKILQDSIKNDTNFINFPQNVINDMKKSILNLKFFEIAKMIEYDVSHKNLKKSQNLINIIKSFNILFESYVNNLSQINGPLLKTYNKKIEDELQKDYRLYIKASLIKIMQIFKNLINENYQAIKK